MFRYSLKLFRVYGIPISVDVSWLLILVLLTWSLKMQFSQEALGLNLTEQSYWLLGLGTALAFFACIVRHELGHAIVAKNQGMPIRGITLFLFGGRCFLWELPTTGLRHRE